MIYLSHLKEMSPPKPGKGIRLAVYQVEAGISGTPAAIEHNLAVLEAGVKAAKEFNAQLISFPEMFLCGYALDFEASRKIAETVDGPALRQVAEIAKTYEMAILCPYPEKAEVAGEIRYYDAMALLSAKGELLKNYRKTHLWGPDEQRLWSFGYVFEEEGEAYTVSHVNDFPVGVLNCYEAEFPELARILALKGVKLVLT